MSQVDALVMSDDHSTTYSTVNGLPPPCPGGRLERLMASIPPNECRWVEFGRYATTRSAATMASRLRHRRPETAWEFAWRQPEDGPEALVYGRRTAHP